MLQVVTLRLTKVVELLFEVLTTHVEVKKKYIADGIKAKYGLY